MDRVTAFLKKKGPLGMPMAFWAGLAAVVLYLGYRWYQNRSGSSASDSSDDSSDDSSTDATGAATDSGTPALPSSIDTSTPSSITIPPIQLIDPAVSKGTGTTTSTDPKTKKKKTLRPKKKPATHHDTKQGTHHTSHRNLPPKKTAHRHAPKTIKRPHSKEKAKVTHGVKKTAHPAATHHSAPKPANIPVKAAAVKHAPAPTHHVAAPTKKTKAPLRKRTRA